MIWWLIPLGLAAWTAVSVVVGLAVGAWLRGASEARERAEVAWVQHDKSGDEEEAPDVPA